jgi:DAK2 domain fusion protein YloV
VAVDGEASPDRARGAPLSAAELPALLEHVHDALVERRDTLDDLNVFPVPDGDTGTNMLLTVRAGLEALRAAGSAPPSELATAVIRGAVRGARGNSGVILSQVVRAVVEVLATRREVDAATYARALQHARELAYSAVAEPVEGTMLTAIAAAADAAAAAVAEDADLVEVSDRVVRATAAAVERTQEQLDVLAEAGVVDAGARGFEVVVAAVHGHLTGQDPPVVHDEDRPHPSPSRDASCHGSLDYRFEVQYLLDADDEVAPTLRHRLEVLGDSVVVVAAGGLLNVHVHTDDVGAAIEEGLRYGRPSEIEVTHFGDQIAARQVTHPPTRVGVVAVLHGPGICRLARELGAVVVEGTAGALPSVADLLNAIGDVRAERIAILPGHRNAVATALKAVDVAVAEGGRPLEVIEPASSPPAVLAALAVFAPTDDPDRVLSDLAAAAAAVRAGEVVAAVRDADTPTGPVRRGQPLAVREGRVVGAFEDPLEALAAICDAVDAAQAEVVTLLVGAEVDDAERDAAIVCVRRVAGGEVEVVDAGCRPSRYWVGAE